VILELIAAGQVAMAEMAMGQIAGAAAILLAAYFIRGITGFGSGLVSVPFAGAVFAVAGLWCR